MQELFDFLKKACEALLAEPIWSVIILNIFMLIASYTDIKSLKIYNKFNLAMLLTRVAIMAFMLISKQMTLIDAFWYLVGGIVMFLMFLIPAMVTLDSIGGDIKFAFNIGLWTGVHAGLLIAVVGSVTNFLFRIFFVGKEDKEPFFKVFRGIPIFFNAKRILPLGPFFYLGWTVLFIVAKIII